MKPPGSLHEEKTSTAHARRPSRKRQGQATHTQASARHRRRAPSGPQMRFSTKPWGRTPQSRCAMTTPQWLRHFKLRRLAIQQGPRGRRPMGLPSSKATLNRRTCRRHRRTTTRPSRRRTRRRQKTCALRALRRRLPEAGYRLTYCHNATLGKRDFYRQLCLAMGLESKATAAGVLLRHQLTRRRNSLANASIRSSLLDEAHLLRQEVLDHLHVLSQLTTGTRNRFSRLSLSDSPELGDRLKLTRNRSLWSRIHCRIRIDDASDEDTVEYICHRLEQAGAAPDPLCKRCAYHDP